MADYKYVMFEDSETGQNVPIIFPNMIVHADIAQYGRSALRKSVPKGQWHPVSAGFLNIATTHASGGSESMDVKSGLADRVTINTMPTSHGMKTGMEEMVEKMIIVKVIEGLLEVARGD